MYIPELDALVFLATEFLEGSTDQPSLYNGIEALHQSSGVPSSAAAKRIRFPNNLGQRACLELLQQLGVTVQEEVRPALWEALGGAASVPLTTAGLLLALVCQADFDAKADFVFWLLDKDSDHKLTKGDVVAAIGPLMHVAQAGMVFMGTSGGSVGGPQQGGASVWEDFRDSMRELATDQVAAAIANGAFDEVDPHHIGRVQGPQFRTMIECIATDVATMMVDVTDLQYQAEQASGERLDSSHSAATGVKAALHKLVKKYAGDETAERLLGSQAKPRRKSESLAGRRSRLGLSSSPQQSSRPDTTQPTAPLSSRAASLASPLPLHQQYRQQQLPEQLPQQQQLPRPTGIRFTSQPQLSYWESRSEAGNSVQSSEVSQRSLPRPSDGATFSNPLYSAQHAQQGQSSMASPTSPDHVYVSQGNDAPSSSSPQGIGPSSLPYRGAGQGISSQSSDVNQGHSRDMHSQSTAPQHDTGARIIPSQASVTALYAGVAQSPSSPLHYSSTPLLGPSIGNPSQQAQDPQAPGTSLASQQTRHMLTPDVSSVSQQVQFAETPWQQGTSTTAKAGQQVEDADGQTADAAEDQQQALSPRQTQDSDAVASSSAQASGASPRPKQGVLDQPRTVSGMPRERLLTQPRTDSGMQRQGWFQNDLDLDDADPELHNLRDPDLERRTSHAQASPSSSPSPERPVNLHRLSQQFNAEQRAQEEERARLRHARMRRADRAAAAANAAIKADMKAMEDAEKEGSIDPKTALIKMVAGVAVRWYLMDIIKLLVILAVLLGDASFVIVLYVRSQLSLELSLGIVFFVNVVLAAAMLIYIATGVNTDIFLWVKDYVASLKEDDSAVNSTKNSTLMKLAAMEGTVPKQLQPTFHKVMQKLQQIGKKDKKGKTRDQDDSDSEASPHGKQSQYNSFSGQSRDGRQPQSPFSPMGAFSRLSRSSKGGRGVSFARRANRGVGGGNPKGKGKKSQEQPEDYMSKAKQLWNYVGKFTGLEAAEDSQLSMTGDSPGGSGHSRSFGNWGSANSRTSRPRPGPSRFGKGGLPTGAKDDYKSATLLLRAEEGSNKQQA